MIIWAAVLLLVSNVHGSVGPSGIVTPDGKNIQFSHEFANNIVLVGPSGIVTRDGRNMQFPYSQAYFNQLPVSPTFRSATGDFLVQTGGVVGPSGIVNPNGRNIQFTQEQADNIAVVGPSGIVTKDGKNIQFRSKRGIGYVSRAGNIGTSGILRADGTTDLFDHNTAHNIVLIGPSGIVTKDGRNMQLTSDLKIAHRTKRSSPLLVGPSGMILSSGQPVQFRQAGATALLQGPSGIILSDGTLVQKWHK